MAATTTIKRDENGVMSLTASVTAADGSEYAAEGSHPA